jgi:hypothetical protein
MQRFFKYAEQIATLDDTTYSIKDLMFEIANRAGYHRGIREFKNGNKRIVTKYTKPFDNVLVCKWFVNYKKLFVSKLISHPELEEFHVQIITETFFAVMKSLNLDKITCDNAVNRLVTLAFGNRIGYVLFTIGSEKRIKDHMEKNPTIHNVRMNSAINHMAISLDSFVTEPASAIYEDEGFDSLLVDLRMSLKDNPYGERMLEAMLYSNKKLQLDHIDDFVYLTKDECNDTTKVALTLAYNTIKSILKSYVGDKSKNWGNITTKKIKYSFERT